MVTSRPLSEITNGNRPALPADVAASPVFIGSTRFTPRSDTKNIMITGGAGFIASWVVRHLCLTYSEYNIISFDKIDYCASTKNNACLEGRSNFAFVKGDITNPEQVLKCMEDHSIDTIMHFAAQSHVDLSFGNSYEFTNCNVLGTHVLLECAKVCNLTRFIHVSTDEVYGEVDPDAEDLLETAILCPTNPYAASKAAAEMLVNAYSHSFKLPVIIARSNNVYGPHQFPEKLIPKFTCLLNRGKKCTLHGNGMPTRRYLFAGDAADAFDTILHLGVVGQIYNIPSVDEISNLTLTHKLLDHFGFDTSDPNVLAEKIVCGQDRPFNDRRYAVDGSKLLALGWTQKTNFEDGLKQTVEWYQKFGENWWRNLDDVLSPFPTINHKVIATPAAVGHAKRISISSMQRVMPTMSTV